MPPATSTFNANMLSSRQKSQLEKDGMFRTSKGTFRDAQGNDVTPPPAAPAATVTQDQAKGMSLKDLSVAMASPVPSPVPATNLQPAPTINLPEPTALEAAQVNNNTIQGTVDSAKNNLTTVLGTQKTEIQREIDALTKQQEDALKEGKELTQPFREKLEEKERKRLNIEKNFEANQKLTEELDSLLTQSNELINIATGRQVSGKVLQKSLTKTLADVQARAGVVEAVMAARNDQITVAERLIDRTVNAIVADRNDELSYYNTIIDLADKKLINLENEKYKIATTERDQAIKDVENAEATATYIKSLMINPETAQFMADAGVTLTDTVEGVQQKMAAQATKQEAIDMRNTLVEMGYEISPVPVPGGIAVEAGGQTLYAKVRAGSELDMRIKAQEANIAQSYASARSSNASAARNETGRLLDLAAAGDPAAISALGLTMSDNTQPSLDLITYAADYAATGKLPSSSGLPKGITVGQVAELARAMPKPDGAIVSTNTGVTATSIDGSAKAGVVAMNEIVNDTLPFMIQKWEEAQRTNFGGTGVIGGVTANILPSQAMTEYKQARDEFLSKLLVARSGAAVTEQEYQRYRALVPGEFNSPFFLGAKGSTLLNNLDNLMVTNFDNFLNSNQLSVYGYSKIEVPAQDVTVPFDTPYGADERTMQTAARTLTVGEVIENEYGQQGIVQPDGSISLINP